MVQSVGYDSPNNYFTRYHEFQSAAPVMFRSNVAFATQQKVPANNIKTDTVNVSAENNIKNNAQQDKKLSTGTKWVIGLTSLLAVGLGAKAGVSKYIRTLVNKKLVPQNLPEHLEFKEATSLDDAYKYLREVLKIEDVDKNISLDALNYINNALTNVANFHKGKVVFPTKINLKDLNKEVEGALAGMHINPFDKAFGTLDMDKKFFDIKSLDLYLKKHLFKKDGSKKYESRNFKRLKNRNIIFKPTDELQDLIDSFYKDPHSLTMKQKMDIKDSLEVFRERLHYNKYDEIKNIKGDDYNIFHLKKINSEITIYHELGHLQDCAHKLPKMGLGYLRHGFVNNEDTKPIFNLVATKNAKEFQNCKNQEIAKKVSEYSKEGIGEFIAETYARAVNGDKLPEDVIALYKKYNGPEIPFA